MFEATAKRTTLADASGTHATSDQTRDHTGYGVQWSDDGKMAESSDHPTAAIWQRDTDLTQADHNTTQDSIINDSGFIPSTPPAKKVSLEPCSQALAVQVPSSGNLGKGLELRPLLLYFICLQFKSILFGVDMFGDRSNKSEILAPDSDEEGN